MGTVSLPGSATVIYLLIFVLALVSDMMIPIGAEAWIISAGAVSSGQVQSEDHAHLHLWIVIVVAIIGELIGSGIGYGVGRYGGRPLVDKVGKYVLLTHRDLDRADAWFAKRGEPFVFFGRFIPLLRSFISLAAGLGEMQLVKFFSFTTVGCAMWCTALALLGDSLGSTYKHVLKDFTDAGLVIAALVVIGVVLGIAHRVRVVRAERAAHGSAAPPD